MFNIKHSIFLSKITFSYNLFELQFPLPHLLQDPSLPSNSIPTNREINKQARIKQNRKKTVKKQWETHAHNPSKHKIGNGDK